VPTIRIWDLNYATTHTPRGTTRVDLNDSAVAKSTSGLMDDKHSIFQGNPSQPSLSGLLDKSYQLRHRRSMGSTTAKVPMGREQMRLVAQALARQRRPEPLKAIQEVYPEIDQISQILWIWCAFERSMRFWTEVMECYRQKTGRWWRSLDRGGHPDPIRHARRLLAKSQKNTDSCSVTVP
jgi:hypothetical protein